MKEYRLVFIFVAFVAGCYSQVTLPAPDPNWNGDPKLCTVDPSTTPAFDKIPPSFPTRAEFTLERVEIKHVADITLPSELTMYQYLYDYDANSLILIKNSNGNIDAEYFYYGALKKSTYIRGQYCNVSNIATDDDMDGTSAIQFSDRTWHVRPLNEFLLFSSNNPQRPIRPRYINQSVVRGILVDQWETCIVDKDKYRTVKRTWSFAQKGFEMPTGIVGDLAVPIQALISASIVYPNNTQIAEFDEIFNIYSYRPGIIETTDQLIPPKGIFCDAGLDQNLVSLRDAGIQWPRRFSVRVEASSSRTTNWQRFHLRYDRRGGDESRRIRYDYLPPGSSNFETVIHDYGDNLTYTIDRFAGTCKINRGVEMYDVSPRLDPIRFFIKNEQQFIFTSRDRIWEFTGIRRCRGDTIKCTAVTASFERFPVIVDPETGKPSGDTWAATSIEYGWSLRSPLTRPPDDSSIYFDYPAYLFLRMYRFLDPNNPSPNTVRSEDIEYEFYEMSHEIHPDDFDTSICYRSLGYEYLHLGLSFGVSDGTVVDGNHLNRRLLDRRIHQTLVDAMNIRYSRVTDLEIDHEHSNDDVTILFTLLGPTPRPESTTGLSTDQPTAQQAQAILMTAIDNNKLTFDIIVDEKTNASVTFTARKGSLKVSKLIMSSHAAGKKIVTESYSKSAEAGGIIGGVLVGLALGVLIAAVVRIARKEPMPPMPDVLKNRISISNPLPKISYYNRKEPNNQTTDAKGGADRMPDASA